MSAAAAPAAAPTSPPQYTSGAFSAKDHEDGKFHLLLGASGSVATIKIPTIIVGLASVKDLSIRVVLTQSAAQFLQGQSEEQPDLNTLSQYPNVDGIYLDDDEWRIPWTRGAPILHIELRRWADTFVIAPLSANTLAKLANGMCDNLLTSVVRAWEIVSAPADYQRRIFVAPAMNTAMWRHPLTAEHLSRLTAPRKIPAWIHAIQPTEKALACGDVGDGAMAEAGRIIHRVTYEYLLQEKLKKKGQV